MPPSLVHVCTHSTHLRIVLHLLHSSYKFRQQLDTPIHTSSVAHNTPAPAPVNPEEGGLGGVYMPRQADSRRNLQPPSYDPLP